MKHQSIEIVPNRTQCEMMRRISRFGRVAAQAALKSEPDEEESEQPTGKAQKKERK